MTRLAFVLLCHPQIRTYQGMGQAMARPVAHLGRIFASPPWPGPLLKKLQKFNEKSEFFAEIHGKSNILQN